MLLDHPSLVKYATLCNNHLIYAHALCHDQVLIIGTPNVARVQEHCRQDKVTCMQSPLIDHDCPNVAMVIQLILDDATNQPIFSERTKIQSREKTLIWLPG